MSSVRRYGTTDRGTRNQFRQSRIPHKIAEYSTLQVRPMVQDPIRIAKEHGAVLLIAKLDLLASNFAFIASLMGSLLRLDTRLVA